jgi:small multidrug resistance family-3 protein
MAIVRSLWIFLLAVVFEIGGCYFLWLWLKEYKSYWYGIFGAALLVAYGITTTFQPSTFGRVYAAYGGLFIIASLAWAYQLDHFRPDRWDIIGAIIVLIGVGIIYYMPRR